MKPIYLEFCGINSFSEKAVIDFKALLSGGVFGIFGDTGSGKSTILDCMHLALYGEIERSVGSEFIHHSAESAYVLFDFEIFQNGKRATYRVRRERRRKNNTSKAWLYEIKQDGGQFALAEGTRDVNEKVQEIVGLSFADFKTCIALPQGDFAALVKSTTSERVKLVSRLFNLEKYGDGLWKAITAKYDGAELEVNVLRAKMEQNEGGSEERIQEKIAEIESLNAELQAAEKEFERLDGRCGELQALQKEKLAFDEVLKKLQTLRGARAEMEKRRALAEKLPFARAVKTAWEDVNANEENGAAAKQNLQRTQEVIQSTQAEYDQAKGALESGKYEKKITELRLKLERIKTGAEDFKAERETQADLDAAQAEWNALAGKCPAEDFDGQIAAIEKKIEKLDADENFLDYLKHNFKDVFLGDAYADFRKELRALEKKYPETGGDIALLLERYTPAKTEDSGLDFALIQAEYKRKRQEVKILQAELDGIRKRKLAFATNEVQKSAAASLVERYKKFLFSLQEKTKELKALGNEHSLLAELERWEDSWRRAKGALEKTEKALQEYKVQAEKYKTLYESGLAQAEILYGRLEKALKEGGFATAQDGLNLLKNLGDEERVKQDCDRFFNELALYESKRAEVDESKFLGFSPQLLSETLSKKSTAKGVCDGLQRRVAAAQTELLRLKELQTKYLALYKELEKAEKQKKLCESIRAMLKGNKFLEFIASEYLQEICIGASQILRSLTGGRYFLRYEKEFKVGDNLNGGDFRAVKTLSGGETFLVSLSLALSLSDSICRKSMRPSEFFFLDEGFGTLDGKLVDTVMDVLGKLSKTFTVGLISHVEELKHRIENKILVTGATETRGSQIKVESI